MSQITLQDAVTVYFSVSEIYRLNQASQCFCVITSSHQKNVAI